MGRLVVQARDHPHTAGVVLEARVVESDGLWRLHDVRDSWKCSLGAVRPARRVGHIPGHAHRRAGRRAPEAEPESVAAKRPGKPPRCANSSEPDRGRKGYSSRALTCCASGAPRASSPRPRSTGSPRPGQVRQRPRWGLGVTAKPRRRACWRRMASCCSSASQLIGTEARCDPFLGALEEPVDHLDARGSLAQHRERVEQSLDAVVALDQSREIGVGLDAIALVVHDQHAAAVLACVHVDDARDQRLARAEARRRRGARGEPPQPLQPPRERGAAAACEQRGDLRALARLGGSCPARGPARSRAREHRQGRASEVERLEQAVHKDPSRSRGEPTIGAE